METLKVTVDTASLDPTSGDEQCGRDTGSETEFETELVFDSFSVLDRILSETNLELIEAIITYRPDSMRETATLVERDIKDVHRNLTELAEYGVIAFESAGRAKRPVVRFDRIEIEVAFRDESTRPLLDTEL